MKALVFSAPGAASVADIDTPTIGPDEVLVRMKAVGICHSDYGLLEGEYILPFSYPVIPGHEWTGEVAEVGSAVKGFKPGDRVVGECAVTDDEHFGFTIDGAIAEYFKASATWLHKVPDSLNDTMGALVEPFTIAYAATANMDASDTVVIMGAGPIGLCAVASAAAKGARVIVSEPDPARQALASKLGAEVAVNPLEVDIAESIAELTKGRGADIVIEASGNARAMASTFDLATFGGRIVNVGINVGARAEAPLGRIVEKALKVQGNVGSFGIWPAALRFLDRTGIDLSVIVSQQFTLEQSLEAFQAAERRDENIKIHITNA
ncbi:zinc-binding dehydrogenase [Rhodococcus sp. NPDC057014]|uniref:zinc-dependent alcohol dehydrogenase n=1 Tax=Rhodococcus sp. NPDC057014 TaxID=3346000 RepID=UPI0036257897